jgi:hypothetical protein
MYRYVEHPSLLHKLSRLAREELRHFEQVLAIIEKRGIAYPQLSAARYASGLRELAAKDEPLRLVDTLLIGALIEARSCERFAALLPRLDAMSWLRSMPACCAPSRGILWIIWRWLRHWCRGWTLRRACSHCVRGRGY